MKKIFIANHTPPTELGDVIIPKNVSLWSTIPKENIKSYLQPLFEEIESIIYDLKESYTIVLAGEPRAVVLFVNHFSQKQNVQCSTTYSVRQSKDEVLPDGSTRKVSFFKFEGLVPFEF